MYTGVDRLSILRCSIVTYLLLFVARRASEGVSP